MRRHEEHPGCQNTLTGRAGTCCIAIPVFFACSGFYELMIRNQPAQFDLYAQLPDAPVNTLNDNPTGAT